MISVIYWFNPLVWIAKNEVGFICEIDCDNYALKILSPRLTTKDYTSAILHLLELSSDNGNKNAGRISALSFIFVRQRLTGILQRPSKKRNIAIISIVLSCVVFTVLLSAAASRAMFYPFPAYNIGVYEVAEATGE